MISVSKKREIIFPIFPASSCRRSPELLLSPDLLAAPASLSTQSTLSTNATTPPPSPTPPPFKPLTSLLGKPISSLEFSSSPLPSKLDALPNSTISMPTLCDYGASFALALGAYPLESLVLLRQLALLLDRVDQVEHNNYDSTNISW